jgi:hypothetical protein
VIDYRIYAPDEDGKSKLDHVADMLNNAVCKKKISFAVIFDGQLVRGSEANGFNLKFPQPKNQNCLTVRLSTIF